MVDFRSSKPHRTMTIHTATTADLRFSGEGFPSYEYWDIRVREGDATIWQHLHSMERGDEGGFSQRLFAALDKADLNNRFRLYAAFPDKFNPKGISY